MGDLMVTESLGLIRLIKRVAVEFNEGLYASADACPADLPEVRVGCQQMPVDLIPLDHA
ncbi:hypothetical protein [Candidatus Poriferisodalis sp.]|uniref:hypothetical protein n=1 Tax=Candidatus Poriferisodalis sp. TaxID=3101277 RepID=UPI003B5203A8